MGEAEETEPEPKVPRIFSFDEVVQQRETWNELLRDSAHLLWLYKDIASEFGDDWGDMSRGGYTAWNVYTTREIELYSKAAAAGVKLRGGSFGGTPAPTKLGVLVRRGDQVVTMIIGPEDRGRWFFVPGEHPSGVTELHPW